MSRLILAVLAFLAAHAAGLAAEQAAPQASPAPRRIVSLNLCTDQLLMALADRDQIGSLSFLARDADLSFLAGEAATLPVNNGSGETVLMARPDLVLAGPYDSAAQLDLLRAQGLTVMTLPPWRSLADGKAQITALAARLGHPARGARLVARIDEALERIRGSAPPRRLLILEREGWTPGETGSLNELVRMAGLRPAERAYGLASGGHARLESIVAHPPDYALIASGGLDRDGPDDKGGGATDLGLAYLAHPALAAAIPPAHRLNLPARLTICDGPSTPAMIDALAAQIRTKVR